MKIVQKLFSMAMLMCMAITMFSCSKDEEEDLAVEVGIIGKWEIESTEMLINGQNIESFITQLAEQTGRSEEELKEEYSHEEEDGKGTFEFKSDKTFLGKKEDSSTASKGVWAAGENRSLIIQYEGQEEVTLTVTSLKSDKATLVFTYENIETFGDTEYKFTYERFTHLKK